MSISVMTEGEHLETFKDAQTRGSSQFINLLKKEKQVVWPTGAFPAKVKSTSNFKVKHINIYIEPYRSYFLFPAVY